ncbi:MAG: lipoate--protein ligase [Defluviitaleaceae bacterium]|nr:lipoate--protein ligase [Defluviitaleaceae bacterium]MCL2836277.1 lipoate--protein ligase [Defluviitaleaceae bacterium]
MIYTSPYTDPATNLAIEEYLCETVKDGVILYLWQNARTVVVGRNQNAWRECQIECLRADGGTLVRRLSGGGAMYQDLGNVNFSFLAPEGLYDVDKQTDVLIAAAASFGVTAEKIGRNDLLAQGRKMSGNAYYQLGKNRCHHGTILISADLEDMGKYLQTPQGKMSGKGVASVRSRVVNLSELADIRPESMKTAMINAFAEIYDITPDVTPAYIDMERITALRERYISPDWTLGKLTDFTWEAEQRFDWGALHIRLTVGEGVITAADIFSDALDADCIQAARNALAGVVFNGNAMKEAVRGAGVYADDIGMFAQCRLES